MSEMITYAYPYFERGFPLRSNDLNTLVKYFEAENRNTRIYLIGSGCVSGLTVEIQPISNQQPVKYNVVLKKGVGVTSLGYLLVAQENLDEKADKNSEVLVFNTVKDANDLRLSDFQDTAAEVSFDPITGIISGNDPKIITDVKEIFFTENGTGIEADSLKGRRVVLLFFLRGAKEGCQNCEKRVSITANIRVLLLTEENLTAVENHIKEVNKECPASDETKFLDSRFPFMERLTIDSAFLSKYQKINSEGLERIKAVLIALSTHEAIKKVFKTALPFETLDTLLSRLPNLNFARQYVNTFLRDIVKAYEEFAETPFGEVVYLLPDKNCFPRHLILGTIGEKVDDPVSTDKRTPFYRPPFSGTQDTNLDKARFLYFRLKKLLERCYFTKDGITDDASFIQSAGSIVRITPSAAVSAPLSQQAVPYYYAINNDLRAGWNFNLQKTERWRGNHGYIRFDAPNAVPPFDEPAKYQSAFDKADFYRIEGHIAKTLTDLTVQLFPNGEVADSKFHQLRSSLNLPFDIKICALQPATYNGHSIPLLDAFASQHPGLEHQGGVPKGGTFVLVVDLFETPEGDELKVIGDFCLPYYVCCKKKSPIAEFIIESPNTFWISKTGSTEVYNIPFIPREEGVEVQVFFKNISKYADKYTWQVGDEITEVLDSLAHESSFTLQAGVVQADFNIRLAAIQNEGESAFTDKILRFYASDEPVIAEFIVESPNNFVQSEEEGPAGGMIEVYTFPVKLVNGAGQVHVYFKNISKNSDTYEWRVDGTAVESHDPDLAFDHSFAVQPTKNEFFVSLLASIGDQTSIIKIKKIRFEEEQEVPVIAEFVVESPNDFEQTQVAGIEVYTFPVRPDAQGRFRLPLQLKNISQHADTYFWQVDNGPRQADQDLAFSRTFDLTGDAATHEILLFASRANMPEVSVTKRIVLRRMVLTPVLAEYVVESPNDFTTSQSLDAQGSAIETYTFPVGPDAQGRFRLPLQLKNISQHADTYFWQVDNEPRQADQDLAFSRTFDLTGDAATHEIRLFASRANMPEVSVTKRIVLRRMVLTPVIAEYVVESPNDFATSQSLDAQGSAIETYTFPVRPDAQGRFRLPLQLKNISQHADTYFWQVDNEPRQADQDLAFSRTFDLTGDAATHEIRLFTSRANMPEVSVTKRIVLRRMVLTPVIAEYVVESPNDFTTSQSLDAQGSAIETYTFPVRPDAQGRFRLPLQLKNISQHADTYFWQVDNEPRQADPDLAFSRIFDLATAEETRLIQLSASRQGQAEVVVVKKIVLRKVDIRVDFRYQATDKDLAVLVLPVPPSPIGQPEKIVLRLIGPGIESIVTKWINESVNADTFHWQASILNADIPVAESHAKTAFRPTLVLESEGISSFELVLDGSNTTNDLTGQKVIRLDVLPFTPG